jgi:hypothetical protein
MLIKAETYFRKINESEIKNAIVKEVETPCVEMAINLSNSYTKIVMSNNEDMG